MPKDYAKYSSQPQRKLAEQGWRKRLFFSFLAACVLGIIILGIYVYKSNALESSRQKLITWIMQARLHLGHKKVGVSMPAKISSVQQVKQEPEVRFNFYTELPNMQVTLSETEETPRAQTFIAKQTTLTTATTTNTGSLLSTEELKKDKKNVNRTGQYILQMGVFKNETAAGQLRVSLLLAGFEMDIVTSTEGNKTVLYHVQKGPYATLSQAKEMQKQLQKKGIIGLIKQL